jgi:hypothetical protein
MDKEETMSFARLFFNWINGIHPKDFVNSDCRMTKQLQSSQGRGITNVIFKITMEIDEPGKDKDNG